MTDLTELPRLRHALRQQLESLRSAGVTHLPVSDRAIDIAWEKPAAAEPQPTPSQPTRPTTTAAAKPAQPPPKRFTGRFEKYSTYEPQPVPEQAPSLFDEANLTPCELSRSEREHELHQLKDRVAACVKCQELAGTRTQTVFGVGNAEAKLMFVGEAPGADEDRQGEPFVGAAGQLLNRIIAACTLTREEVYICNILRCRPPGNRNPTDTEADNCREFLDAQIRIVDPDYIVCLGSVAARNLLRTTASVGKLRGRLFMHNRAKVLCTYHPSYLLRNAAAKRDVWDDMKFLMRDVGVEL